MKTTVLLHQWNALLKHNIPVIDTRSQTIYMYCSTLYTASVGRMLFGIHDLTLYVVK